MAKNPRKNAPASELPPGCEYIDRSDAGQIPLIKVDPDIAYPAIGDAIGLGGKPGDDLKKECVYNCLKFELQRLFGFAIEINIGNSAAWRLADPHGAQVAQADRGGEARRLFVAWRGGLPQA